MYMPETFILLLTVLQFTGAWYMFLYNGLLINFIVINRENASSLMENVNPNQCIIFLFHGFTGNRNMHGIPEIAAAYLQYTHCHIVAVDWSSEAYNNNTIPNYYKAAENSQTVGEQFGFTLAKFHEQGLNLGNCTLVCISLSAHLCGKAGAVLTVLTNEKVYRIVVLDGAKPFFEPETFRRIKSSDALVVLQLKTDMFRFGLLGNYGTHNYEAEPIYYSVFSTQPGCGSLSELVVDIVATFEKYAHDFLTQIFCSHARSVFLWIENIEKCTVIGKQASSVATWPFKSDIYACFSNITAPGNHYFRTNSKSPYGMGIVGAEPY